MNREQRLIVSEFGRAMRMPSSRRLSGIKSAPSVAVHQSDPGPGMAGVAALGLAEDRGDGMSAAGGDVHDVPAVDCLGPAGGLAGAGGS